MTAVSLILMVPVIAGACGSSKPHALKIPACSLVSLKQVQVVLGVVQNLHTTVNQLGACSYTGTVTGLGTANLTYKIILGTGASAPPLGVVGKIFRERQYYGAGGRSGYVESYWIPTSPAVDYSPSHPTLYSGVLSASKDGCLIRISILSRVPPWVPAGQVMAVLLAQV